MNKKGEAGLIGKMLPMLIVVAILVTASYVFIGDMSSKYNFELSESVNRSYTYSSDIITDIDALRTETTNKTSWIDEAKEGFMLFTLPFRIAKLIILQPYEFIKNSVSDGANFLGLPEEQAGFIGSAVSAIILISLIVAFASLFVRRAI